MEQRATPRPLLTTADLKTWLRVTDGWVKLRLAEPEFVARCVVNLAPEGSERRTLRYVEAAVAEYLGIPLPEAPSAPGRRRRTAA